MALLYRQVASDLSALRQEGTARTIEAEVNQLLSQAHAVIYSRRKTNFLDIWAFISRDYPRLFRQLLPFTLASTLLFLSGALLGALLTLVRPEFKRHFLGPVMVQTIERHEMWTQSVSSMAPQTSSAIMTNNLTVTFTVYAAGIIAGLGTLYMIAWNGVLLGVIAHRMPPGPDEREVMELCRSARLAGDTGDSHCRRRRPASRLRSPLSRHVQPQPFALGSRSGFGAPYVRVVPMLVVAGILEGFLSPSSAPVVLKFATASVLFTALVLWLSSAKSLPHQPLPAQNQSL